MKTMRVAALLGFVLTVFGGSQLASAQLLVDSDFNASSDSTALRTNSAGQDWYESRQDGTAGPTLLTLDTASVGGNATKKAKLTGSTAATGGNAYLTQEFSSAQTGRFSVQWRIYVDSILNISGHPDCAGWMLIGDDSNPSSRGPNANDSERFVYMAFHKDGGGTSGTMDLVAMERGSTTLTPIATNLSLKQWYTIRVDLDLAADAYDVYVDNNKVAAAWPARNPKDSVTHISFAQWNDGAGTFYVDDVTAETSGTDQAGEIVVVDESWYGGGLVGGPEMPIQNPGQVAQSWSVTRAPAGASVTGFSYVIEVRPVVREVGGPSPFRCSDYEIGLSSATRGGTGNYLLAWDNLGGDTDQNLDDDAENDNDIALGSAASGHVTNAFNGQPVNQNWYFRVNDTVSGSNYGCLTRLKLVIQYAIPSIHIPSVTTEVATGVQCASATVNGKIVDDGGEACQYRFRYKMEGGSYVYTSYTGSKRTSESFSQTLTGLSSGTKYYFAAQAKNSAGESAWGNELSFTTAGVTVETQAATTIKCSSATLNGKIVDDGGQACQYRFRYKTASGSYTYTNYSGSKRTNESFSQALTGLSPGTAYYFAAQAKNSTCESAWGTELSFTTVRIQADTQAATAIKCSSATLNGKVTADGGVACQYKFRYKKEGGTYTETAWTGSKTAGQTFSQAITGLDPGTRYYFAAQVKNSSCQSDWGIELSFMTILRAETRAATDVKCTTATLNGRIADDGGEACQYKFRYKKEGGTYIETTWTGAMRTNESFSYALTGLSPGTKYYFAAKARNSTCETLWGTELTFTTFRAPVVTTQAATPVKVATATLNGKLTDDGGAVCEYRFRYKKEGGAYTETPWTGSKRTGETCSQTISGLNQGTKYFFAAQARNAGCEGAWGSDLSFTTLAIEKPTVSTLDVTNIEAMSATLAGKIVDDGNEPCQYRFRYRWTIEPLIPLLPSTSIQSVAREQDSSDGVPSIHEASENTVSGGVSGPIQLGWPEKYTSWRGSVQETLPNFSEVLSGLLTPNIEYRVAAQAMNSAGESDWGNEVTFRSLAAPVITDLYGTYFTRIKKGVYFLDGISLTEQITVRINWNGLVPGKVQWRTPRKTYEETCSARQTKVSRSFDVGTEFGAGGKLQVRATSSGPDGKESLWVAANFTVIPQPPMPSGMVLRPVVSPYGGDEVASLVYDSGPYLVQVLDADMSLYYGLSIPNAVPMFGGNDVTTKVQGVDKLTVNSQGVGILTMIVDAPAEIGLVDRCVLWVAGVDLEFGLTGYANFYFDGNSWVTSGQQRFWNDTRVPIWSWGYSLEGIGLSLTVGVESHMANILLPEAQGNTLAWAGTVSLWIPAWAEGVADAYVAGLEVEAKGAGLNIEWTEPGHELLEFCLDFRVEVSAHIWRWDASKTFGPWEYCPYDRSLSSQAQQSLSIASATGQVPLDVGSEGWKLMGRDYLGPDYGVWLPPTTDHQGGTADLTVLSATTGAQGEGGAEQVLQTKVFEYSEPAVAADKGELLLAWVYDNPARSSVNCTQVVFSTSHEGTWTPPVAIHDDGTADFSPQLAVLPAGKVLCAWQNVNRSLPDSVDLAGMAAAMDIAVASYDSATGLWRTTALTNDSHLDYMPQIAAATNNTALVTWVSNEKDDIFGQDPNAPNTIRYCFWNGRTWSKPSVAGTGIGSLLRPTLAYDGTKAVYVYAADADWDTGTDEDKELYALVYEGTQWSKPLRLTNDKVPDVNPQVVFDQGEPLLVWYRDGSIVSCRGLDTSMPQHIVQITGVGARDFRLAKGPTGRVSLVWTSFSTASKGTDVFTATYDPAFGVWSSAYPLTSDSDVEKALAVTYVDSDELALAYNKDRIRSHAKGVPEIYQTDLCVLRHGLGRDLAVAAEDISVSPANPKPGSKIQIAAVIHNLGDVAEANVPVAFYHGNPHEGGVRIGGFQTIAGPIPAGGTATVTVSWTIPKVNSPQQIYVTASVATNSQIGLEERNQTNNIAHISLMAPDLIVKSVSVEKIGYKARSITATIANAGVVAAQNVGATIRRDSLDGQALKSFTIPVIDANSSQEVSFDWDISAVDFNDPDAVLYVVADGGNSITESDEHNNTSLCLVHVSKRGDITDDGSVDFDDLMVLSEQWLGSGSDSEGKPNGDANHNGRIDAVDLAILSKNWHWAAAWHTE